MARDGNHYVSMSPKLWKWINPCVVCQRTGYKPDLPENIYPGIAAQNPRRSFPMLDLTLDRRGDECQQAINASQGDLS